MTASVSSAIPAAAQPPGARVTPDSLLPSPYLTFTLGGDYFAIGILSIKEIIEYRAPTQVPMSPPGISGVINLRGVVVPVMDPRVRFGQAPSEVAKRTCIVIVEVNLRQERQVVGVLVDAVCEVLDIPAADIESPPSFGARIRSDFIAGIGKVRDNFVILLDVNRVLGHDEAQALAHLPGAAETSH